MAKALCPGMYYMPYAWGYGVVCPYVHGYAWCVCMCVPMCAMGGCVCMWVGVPPMGAMSGFACSLLQSSR
jgi:hypothetical protein